MLTHGLLWVSLLCYVGVYCSEDMLEFLQNSEALPLKQKMVDNEADDLKREVSKLSTLSDTDYEGILEQSPIRFDENNKVENATGKWFRTGSALKSRGSSKPVQMHPKPLEHAPATGEPEGCGNPICVMLDAKPRRFSSLCTFKEYLKANNRLMQVNFVQKGDCYDIIDGDGAREKPWITKKPADCSACAKDENCNGHVVMIVDVGSMLKGESSAPGGGQFKETSERSKKLGAFPLTFPTICDAMTVFEGNPNLNIKTQTIGFITEKNAADLFSPKSGDECLWTEWFDHDTPCNSEDDKEWYSEHYYFLQSSYTGPYRICQTSHISETQHEGGSEITQVSADDAKSGNAKGDDGKQFKQVIQFSQHKIECKNSEQTIKELPPPFIFSEDKNNTCLDYKSRYCCKTKDMWKPVEVGTLAARFPETLPVGLAVTYVTASTDAKLPFSKMVITVYSSLQKSEVKKIEIRFKDGSTVEGTLKFGQDEPFSFTGTYKQIKKPDGSSKITLILKSKMTTLATIEVMTHKNAEVTVATTTTITESSSNVVAKSQVLIKETVETFTKVSGGKTIPTEESVLKQAVKIDLWISAELIDQEKGKKVIEATIRGEQLTVKKETGALVVTQKTTNVWEMAQKVITTYGITTLVESPPVAILFHECEWRDWVNMDYPGANEGVDGEYELRQSASNKTKFVEHVCGSEPSHAHYIDAVTMEDLKPWYELKMENNKTYETFKLTPYFGYACKDVNGSPKFCKDMKVRYCCEKQRRASWGDWEEWSSCTATCDGGVQKRTRKCVQLSVNKKESSTYNKLCYGQESYHNLKTKERFTTQSKTCNIENCPVDYSFSQWTLWTSCSATCDQGFKTKTRSCFPAQNGGKKCPPKTDVTLYVKSEPCTSKDCERFEETLWTRWSACSATCGEGLKTRKRKCRSMITLQIVSDDKCIGKLAQGQDILNQKQACSLQSCPVNGGWTAWGKWSACSQNCIHHPESDKKVETKAFINRERHCAEPIPKFGGKPCARDKKFIYKAETKAEEERGDCITPDSKDKPKNAVITQWCPENCIYTQWGEWSMCSHTCVPISMILQSFDPAEKMSDVVYIENAATAFPTRQRIRMIVKDERFNGECPEKMHNFDIPSSRNATVLSQTEQCSLCKEHCTNKDNPDPTIKELRHLKKLDYPSKDPGCVGYCPESCELNPPAKEKDCEKEIKIYLEERVDYIERHKEIKTAIVGAGEEIVPDCFLITSEYFARKYDEIAAQKFISKKFDEIMAAKEPEKRNTVPDELMDLLADLFENEEDRANEITDAYINDLKAVKKIWWSEFKAVVKEPWVDGIAGGTDCVNNVKSKGITSRAELIKDKEKYDPYPFVKEKKRDCELNICKLTAKTTTPNNAVTQQCVYHRWSEWGEYGQCDVKCGDKGRRTRTRHCQDTCMDKKVEDDKCTPYQAYDYVLKKNSTWTTSNEAPCQPCPSESIGTWSTWSTWSWMGAPACAKEEGLKAKQSRERTCIEGPDKIECKATAKGLTTGKDVEEIETPIPKCDAVNRGASWKAK